MPTIPASLHLIAASIFALTIPKHTAVGLTKVAEATKAIPNEPRFAIVRHLIGPTWLGDNASLAMAALLNIKWARFGGPSTLEEKLIVWVQLISGIALGITYYKKAMYAGLPVLFGANILTAAAMLLG